MTRLCVITLLGPLAVACGGSQASPESPEKSAVREAASPKTAPAESPEPEEKPRPAARRCADGTCFVCGSGFCPAGFYCDEGAKGGAACSWLPACASKGGCGCLSRALSGCKCDDGEGGPHVKCD